MITTKGNISGHPRVTIEYRPSGPVVVHDKRGSAEEIRRGRLKAGAAWLIGVAITGYFLSRSVNLNLVEIGLAALVLLGLSITAGYWMIPGRDREEIALAAGFLQVRALPLDLLSNSTLIYRPEIDRLQVEKDTYGGRDRFRVQIVDFDGQGKLPNFGALSGMATPDEATALANAIAQQFGLQTIPGVQAAVERPAAFFEKWTNTPNDLSKFENSRTVNRKSVQTDGNIRITQIPKGAVIKYSAANIKRAVICIFSVFWLGITAGVTVGTLTAETMDPESMFLLIFWGIGIYALGIGVGHTEIRRVGGRLDRRYCLGPIPVSNKEIALDNIEQVSMTVFWDSYDNMHHRVVAQGKWGNELVLINDLPEEDGHALCQVLHQLFGLPI